MRNYKVKPITALARGLAVLRALQEMRAASLHDLHRATHLSKSTLTRIVFTLFRQGLIWQRMVDGAYLPSHSLQQRAQLDDANWLVELASPVLEQLCQKVPWPSVLTIPRLDHVEVLETNSTRSYFDVISVAPIGFRANLLRSASGRAYLAFCPDSEREAVLRRLRERGEPGNERAHDAEWVQHMVESTRQRGYSIRDPDFGGHYFKPRQGFDDERSSIAMPILVNAQVLGCINLTWKKKLLSLAQAVERHLETMRDAVSSVEQRARSEGVGAVPPRLRGRPAANGHAERRSRSKATRRARAAASTKRLPESAPH
jgi:IclR family transcriptional regulator, mhp operon transcriptional activator